jgi:cation-transporting ATPase E
VSRSYLQILRQNAFTFINTILFAIGIALVLMGQHGDAVVTAGLVLLNVIVGVYQEGRAKRKLDQIALLTRPQAAVVRAGQERSVDPAEIVQDDVLVARPGDQIVVDGQVVGEGRMEVDESLLTGESDLIAKGTGDPVYSGSFCVSGGAFYRADKVGTESYAHQLTASARAFRQVKTPLQRAIDLVIRVIVLLVTQLGILLALSFAIQRVPLVEGVRVAAVIVALVPQGLFFMITVAYAMGAFRVAGQGALIQRANAVESVSNVDLLCLDKTGTLTTSRVTLEAILPVGEGTKTGPDELRRTLGDYVATMSDPNRTVEAISQACPGEVLSIKEKVPFSSERKWSALASEDETLRGITVLGAPEVLGPVLPADPVLEAQAGAWAAQGLRVLTLARRPEVAPLHAPSGEPRLPSHLDALALLSFRDELRTEARETLAHLAGLGVGIKIISGDHPHTVAALARQVGLEVPQILSGLELDGLDEVELARRAEETAVFGRITPGQKERLIAQFQKAGHYVAMIGDGVNDVLSLKQAQVGIAMQSGSAAARGVADLILLQDSFAVLPVAFREGQRIVRGMEDIVRLLLTRTVYALLLIIATQMVGVPFPVTPKHNSIIAFLTVGLPILAIAAWARPGTPARDVIRATSRFVFPAAFTIAVLSLCVYLAYLELGEGVEMARTALTTTCVLCGLLLIPFVEPPSPAWVGGDDLSGDRRPAFLALGMLLLYLVVTVTPPLSAFFELTLLRGTDYLLLAALAVAWAVVQRAAWRARLLERLLSQHTA